MYPVVITSKPTSIPNSQWDKIGLANNSEKWACWLFYWIYLPAIRGIMDTKLPIIPFIAVRFDNSYCLCCWLLGIYVTGCVLGLLKGKLVTWQNTTSFSSKFMKTTATKISLCKKSISIHKLKSVHTYLIFLIHHEIICYLSVIMWKFFYCYHFQF